MIEVVSTRPDLVNLWISEGELRILRTACDCNANRLYELGLPNSAEVYASIQSNIEHALKVYDSEQS